MVSLFFFGLVGAGKRCAGNNPNNPNTGTENYLVEFIHGWINEFNPSLPAPFLDFGECTTHPVCTTMSRDRCDTQQR